MMNIAIALNRKFVKHTYIMLYSVLKNNSDTDVCVYVLHSELLEEDCRLLQSLEENYHNAMLRFVYIDRNILPENLPITKYWTIEMYYRLMLVDLLPVSVTRILYLDVDMIVNKDIHDFYDADFDGKSLIVSKDMEFDNMLEHAYSGNAKHDELFKQFQEEGHTYFCSGMILFNIKKIREEFSFEKYMDIFIQAREFMVYPDQDLLNYVHRDDVKYVDELQYGIFAQTAHVLGYSYDDLKRNASIIHFTGQAKPWTNNLIRYDIEKIWWEYARETPFFVELMQQVFWGSMESSFVEDQFKQLSEENEHLKDLLFRYQKLVEKLSL